MLLVALLYPWYYQSMNKYQLISFKIMNFTRITIVFFFTNSFPIIPFVYYLSSLQYQLEIHLYLELVRWPKLKFTHELCYSKINCCLFHFQMLRKYFQIEYTICNWDVEITIVTRHPLSQPPALESRNGLGDWVLYLNDKYSPVRKQTISTFQIDMEYMHG